MADNASDSPKFSRVRFLLHALKSEGASSVPDRVKPAAYTEKALTHKMFKLFLDIRIRNRIRRQESENLLSRQRILKDIVVQDGPKDRFLQWLHRCSLCGKTPTVLTLTTQKPQSKFRWQERNKGELPPRGGILRTNTHFCATPNLRKSCAKHSYEAVLEHFHRGNGDQKFNLTAKAKSLIFVYSMGQTERYCTQNPWWWRNPSEVRPP